MVESVSCRFQHADLFCNVLDLSFITSAVFLFIPFCCFPSCPWAFWIHVLFDLLSWKVTVGSVPLCFELIIFRVSFVCQVLGRCLPSACFLPWTCSCLGGSACMLTSLSSQWGASVGWLLGSLSIISGKFVFLQEPQSEDWIFFSTLK